ncbi:MAG: TonB-dependent receptor [bacterium]|nr:TonB-dependent receptor [bacterium]
MNPWGRYEDHEIAGTSSVPRVGWTKIWDKFHLKLLASQAFRTPTAGLLSGEEIDMDPETTTVFEIETGYQFTSNFFLTSNIYNIKIEDLIVFSEQEEGYTNYEEVGTQGIELELKWIDDWGYLYLTYSFYDVHTNNLLDEEYVFSTPYNNGGKSLPGPSREIFIKFSTSF